MRPLITTLAILFALTCSCEKKPTLEGEIHIFLLSDAATQDPLWETEESNLVRELVPLIEYKDILSYDPVDHIFKISSTVQENPLSGIDIAYSLFGGYVVKVTHFSSSVDFEFG